MKKTYQSPMSQWAKVEMAHCVCESIQHAPERNLGHMHNITYTL